MQQAKLLVHILAFQARPTPRSAARTPEQVQPPGQKKIPFLSKFHDLYIVFFLVTEAYLVHVAVFKIVFYMLAQFEIVFEILQVGESFCL